MNMCGECKTYLENICDDCKIKLTNNWISVKDRLPKNGIRLLFVCNGLKKVLVDHHINNGLFQLYPGINEINHDQVILTDATHWMPLPEPPSE